MRRTVLLLLTLLLGLTALPATAENPPDLEAARAVVKRIEKQRIELAHKLAPSVCAVFRGQGGGSGVIITKDGLVLSNFHVTQLSNQMRIGLNDQRIHPAVVLGVDPSGDLSLLRLTEKRDWTFTPLGDSDAMRQGDYVYAMGNPFLLATDFTPTITFGVVSGINRYQPGSIRGTLLYPDCIQTDASINPGNSGGPLFNFSAEVVGINGRVSLRDRGRVNIGVGYAISSNQIKLALPDMRAGKVVEHGTLNATVRSITDPEWPTGVRVTFDQLLAPGCAHDAGIQIGDALVSFMGKPVRDVNQFSRMIAVLPKGRVVTLTVARYNNDDDGGTGEWKETSFRLALDGIPLIKKSKLATKSIPKKYIDHEIDRTFSAAAKALQPIDAELRRGTLTVRGRKPRALEERYKDGSVTITLGKRVRTATAKGGQEGDKPLGEEKHGDMMERWMMWNDLLRDNARKEFAKVDFTGGALVGGITADRFEITTRDDDKRVYFIHLDTGRLLRVDLYSRTWVRWISLRFSDWREANGLLRPYKTTIHDRKKHSLLQTVQYLSVQGG